MAGISKKKIISLFLVLILILATIEITLRLQQRLGPIVDLEFSGFRTNCISDTLNHVCIEETIFDWSPQESVKRYYDSNGIRINKLQPNCTGDCRDFRILFMGDSSMEGLDDAHTIPNCARQYLERVYKDDITFIALNAGCTSYSPAIYIPQAKILIPLLKPDFVVVDINENDIGDDFVRYRNLIVRDAEGGIVAVRRSPALDRFVYGFIEIRKQPLYLTRLISKIYHTRIYIPLLAKKYNVNDMSIILAPSIDKNATFEKYTEEITFFENNLTELVETLIRLMRGPNRILFTFHPQLQHLQPDSEGFYWNNFTSESVARVCQNYGVAFYNGTQDFKDLSGGDPQKFYIPADFHFNHYGTKTYGEFVAAKMLPIVKPLIKKKWPDID